MERAEWRSRGGGYQAEENTNAKARGWEGVRNNKRPVGLEGIVRGTVRGSEGDSERR